MKKKTIEVFCWRQHDHGTGNHSYYNQHGRWRNKNTVLSDIQIPGGNQFLYVGMIGYALFLFLPSIIQMGEDITWYILKSKI